ncbi:hypothetical protein [Caballeronia sp. RCC_10]|uniref:hypothetical protein n=1 Tax=Caballeronia sp. RCC_10 TaxID=3239227 RepID=UPI003524F38C
MDSHGKTASGTADANGAYALTIADFSGPVLLTAIDPTGQHDPLVSVVTSAPDKGKSTTANITTLTTAIGALLTSTGNALDLRSPATLAAATSPATVSKASSTLNAALADILKVNGLDPSSFNAVTTPFAANQSGADAVIESVQIIQNGAGAYLVSSGNAVSGLRLSNATVPSAAPLVAPPAAANYLAFMQSLLQQCLAAPVATRASNAACTAAVDANYKQNGYPSVSGTPGSLANAATVGATVGAPETLMFFKDSNGTQSALVRIPYAPSDGSQNSLLTTVRQVANPISLADGTKVSWTIYGNQREYDASVESRITRRTFLDNEAGDIGHYDAGVTFNFNLAGPNATNVGSALVTGPGLPSTGIFLLTSTACGEQSLEIPGVAPTPLPPAPGPAGNVTTSSTTPLYRWSWQVFDPAQASAFTPPARYFWSTSQVDLTNVPFYATYTFTLFDAVGNMLDQFQATNPNPAVTANLGTQVEWHTATSNDLLAPGAPAIGQATLTWERNRYAPPLFGVGLYTQSNSAGVIGTASVTGAATSATLVAGNGATTCVNTTPQFLALQPGTYRFTNLQGRNQHGVRFIDNLIFRNGSSAPNAS